MDKRNFAFDRVNFILIAISMAVIVLGFILMSGPGSTDTMYNPDIFSARRIKLAPALCVIGFFSMIYSVLRRPKGVAGNDGKKEKNIKPEGTDELV